MKAVVKAFGNTGIKYFSYDTKINPNFKTVYNVGYDRIRVQGGKKSGQIKRKVRNQDLGNMRYDATSKIDVNDLRYMDATSSHTDRSLPMGPAYINKDGYIVRRIPDMSKRQHYPMRQPTMETTIGPQGNVNLSGWSGKLKTSPDFKQGGGMEKPHNTRRQRRDEKFAPTPNTEPRETVPWVKPWGKSHKAKSQYDPELRFNEAEKKRVANMKVPYAQRDMETPLGKYIQSLDRGGKVDRKARRIDEWRRHTSEGEWRSFDNPMGPSTGKVSGSGSRGDKWGRFYSRNTRMLEEKKGVVKPLPKRQHSGQLSERPQRHRPSERRRLHPNHTPQQIQQAKKLPTEADLDRKLANIKARRDGGT